MSTLCTRLSVWDVLWSEGMRVEEQRKVAELRET